MNDYDYFLKVPTDTIQEGLTRTERFIATHDNIMVSISGGADSDCMLDVVSHLDKDKKCQYVFFDTGIEMDATKRHLDYLSNRYDIPIKRIKSHHGVAYSVPHYGYPFMSKRVSEYVHRLQIHNFRFEDRPFDILYKEYPNCKAALRWWCNEFGTNSIMNINRQKGLKEFMIENPPDFHISPLCCEHSKKRTASILSKEYDIQFVGIRKYEGGARSTSIKTCFSEGRHGKQHYPLFWWKDSDRLAYENTFAIKHSDAYCIYGCKRTGCAGCPFGSGFETELKMLEQFEPKLYKCVANVFSKSYKYTRAYRMFKR